LFTLLIPARDGHAFIHTSFKTLMAAALDGYSAATLLSAPKHAPLTLTLRAHGATLRTAKSPGESVEHLLLKAMMWTLFLPTHPNAACEFDLGLRYRPDVIALDDTGAPLWWGECGSCKPSKLRDLAATFPRTRFSVAKWGRSDLRGYAGGLRSELSLRPTRSAPFELLSFPADSVERFLSDDGELDVSFDDIDVISLV